MKNKVMIRFTYQGRPYSVIFLPGEEVAFFKWSPDFGHVTAAYTHTSRQPSTLEKYRDLKKYWQYLDRSILEDLVEE